MNQNLTLIWADLGQLVYESLILFITILSTILLRLIKKAKMIILFCFITFFQCNDFDLLTVEMKSPSKKNCCVAITVHEVTALQSTLWLEFSNFVKKKLRHFHSE